MKVSAVILALMSSPSFANDTPFYLSLDISSRLSIEGDAFDGYQVGEESNVRIGSSGMGGGVSLGWVVTPRVSLEAGYFTDPDIIERIPESGRVLEEGMSDYEMIGLKSSISGYGVRVRYFLPMSSRLDFAVGTGWQRATVKQEAQNFTNTNLMHSAGITYAINRNFTWRLEYHYKQNYFTTNGFDYSGAEFVTFGFEYHF
ncbi:outer membrane protein [Aliidiomarina quisquiliarum]|uniref:outer membrane protein n=1 Tax=Aliidiomarina quisquiliarum TaxID=2938947 RepID=UPI00208EA6A3|nr:outer membrane beta-barrel protein [Aliidiomarina quisquiliarum]MCO4319954.1 porin family protein [Aliidiomarina quisquiliarum]